MANINDYFRATLGQKGFDFVTAGSANGATRWNAIQVIETAVVTVVASKGDSFTSLTIPAGIVVYGSFTTVTVTGSGKVLAYIA
jgi:hypothetical protein